jgi:hypothetical protein
LRLDFEDRLEIFRLALPEGHALEQFQQRSETAAVEVLSAMPRLLHGVSFWSERRRFTRVDIETVRGIAAIVEVIGAK